MRPLSSTRDALLWQSTIAKLHQPAFDILRKTRKYAPHEQLLGTAMAMVAMAEAIDISPYELLQRAERILTDEPSSPYRREIAAIKDFARGEMMKTEP